MNPVFEADYIDRMFAKCHEDFVKDPLNTSYLIVVPELRDAPWYKRWVKYYDIIDKHPRGSKLFSTKAAHTYNTSRLEPARNAGNAGRVFVDGTPWPVIVLYRNSSTTPTVDNALLAHLRFGHAHSRRIDALTANGVPTGLNLEPRELTHCNPSCSCATCKTTKMPRHGPYRAGDPHRHEHLDAFAYSSSDISGPFSPPSPSGYRYILVFIDRATIYSFLYFLMQKSDAADALREFLGDIKLLGRRPATMTIKTDAEAVYISGAFESVCKENAIRLVNSPPYVHEKNSSAEKYFRDIGDIARALMHTAGFPASSWPLAYRHANWLRNRLPSEKLGFDTPYFRAFGSDYDLSRVRVFGCRAFAHVPASQRTKLDDHAVAGLYVGHNDRAGGAYLVHFPGSNTTKTVSDPVFIEDIDSYASKLTIQDAVPELPLNPADVNRVRPAPFSEAIDHVDYSVISLGSWYTDEDHELVALVQLDHSTLDSPFWTTATTYLMQSSDRAHARKQLRTQVASWRHHGTISSFHPLFADVTCLARGGKQANLPAIVTAVDTSLTDSNSTMYTVVYNPDTKLDAQDLPESRLTFETVDGVAGALQPQRRPMSSTPTPKNYIQAMASVDQHFWIESISNEMTSIDRHGVIEYGKPPRDANIIGTMFVFKKKLNDDGSVEKFKTRLVGLGNHQEFGETFTETFAPGTQISSSRLILLLALVYNLDIHHMDVKTAFLQADFTDEVHIWVRLPPGFTSSSGHRHGLLRKPLYGIRQAAREWYITLKDYILNSDTRWKQSKVEPQIYYISDSTLFCAVMVHTDDFFGICSDDEFWKSFLKSILARFDIDVKGNVKNMLQMHITRDHESINLSQKRQILEILEHHGEHLNLKVAATPMEKDLNLPKDTTVDDKLPYRVLIGQLLWISRCTRPDIAYSVSYLSQFSNVANKEHWTALLRVLRYLKKTIDRPLVLKVNSTTTKDLVINVEADSDWAGDRTDRKSQTGVLVTLNGGVLNYFSSKQATVSLSSTEAEYIAAAEACKEGLYFRNLINELKPVQLPIHLHVDNLGAGFIAQNSVNNNRTKHIDIKWHMIRDWIAKKVFELFYIKSCDNRADLLTKALAGPAHSALTDRVLSAKPLDSGSQD